MEMYKRNNSRIQKLIKNIDLHILHSMNPDGFEKAEQVCKSKIGRSNAKGSFTNYVNKILACFYTPLPPCEPVY